MAARTSPWPQASGYLDTAAYGLPPDATVAAMREWIDQWASGRTPYASWLAATETSREAFARLLGIDASNVATGTGASQLVGVISASLPDRACVLVAENEFTSLLYPLLVQSDRGVTVREVPLDRLPEEISTDVDLVALSLVSSGSGELAAFEPVVDASAAAGAATLVDAAQACGWLAIDWGCFDYVVCPAFKWLCCPRGVAFLAVAPQRLEAIRPQAAGWFASEDSGRFFGGPLLLPDTARRLDPSPAWPSWAGAAPALDLLASVGTPEIGRRAIGLANHFRDAVGLEAGSSPLVSVDVADVADTLRRARLVATARPTSVRLAFHYYNDEADADRAAAALAPLLGGSRR
jgi:selenocysteine lyase/cysteine desulfurase